MKSFYFKDCDFTQLPHAIRVLGGVLDKPGHKLKLIIVENGVSARYTWLCVAMAIWGRRELNQQTHLQTDQCLLSLKVKIQKLICCGQIYLLFGGNPTMVNHCGDCLNWVEFQVLNKDQTCGLKDYSLNRGGGSWVKSITEEVKDNWSVVSAYNSRGV